MASLPEAAVSISNPLTSRIVFNVRRIEGSSSARRIRRFMRDSWGRNPLRSVTPNASTFTRREPPLGNHEACHDYNTSVPGFFLQNFGCRATQADGAMID